MSFQARIDLGLIDDMFERRLNGESIVIPKGLEHNFVRPNNLVEEEIKRKIDLFHAQELMSLQRELFELKKRLNAAEKKLSEKFTKTAEKEKGISERQIERKLVRLQNIQRSNYVSTDDRIYPFNWTLVMIAQENGRTMVPMRYHLRPSHKDASFDQERPGCYNARRDNLTRFWRKEFGKKHGIIILSSFFENVSKHVYEKRMLIPGEKEENLILQFIPEGIQEMVVPIIWDAWSGPSEPSFSSFAIITDEPPLEISEAGHDRCPIFINPKNIDAWLSPEGRSDGELFTILDDRVRPQYRHEIAAA
ncbi:MAG: SOS response-associated peptidase [Bdellovibrionales bacterium]|nr:SOS response-associated peptidase [Bdellovibrionales bacterium]